MKRLVLFIFFASCLVLKYMVTVGSGQYPISSSMGVALSTKNDNAPTKLQQRQIEEGVNLFIYFFFLGGWRVSNLVG
jgi:maltodextrin utilization protein YvdJ